MQLAKRQRGNGWYIEQSSSWLKLWNVTKLNRHCFPNTHTSNFTMRMHKLHTNTHSKERLFDCGGHNVGAEMESDNCHIRLASWCVQFLIPITLPYFEYAFLVDVFICVRQINAISWTVEVDTHLCSQIHHHPSPTWWSNKCNSH